MTKEVRFELPVDYRDEEIISFFMWPPEDLNDALDLDVGQAGDSRLTIDDIRVEQVDLAADKISIQYEIEYSAYYGCDDANFSDCDSREVVGRREGNTFVFDHVSLPEPRNTYDEY